MDVPGRCLGTCDAPWIHHHISHDVLAVHDGIMELLTDCALIDFILKLLHHITLHSHVPQVWTHHERLQCALMRHSYRALAYARANVYTPARLNVPKNGSNMYNMYACTTCVYMYYVHMLVATCTHVYICVCMYYIMNIMSYIHICISPDMNMHIHKFIYIHMKTFWLVCSMCQTYWAHVFLFGCARLPVMACSQLGSIVRLPTLFPTLVALLPSLAHSAVLAHTHWHLRVPVLCVFVAHTCLSNNILTQQAF